MRSVNHRYDEDEWEDPYIYDGSFDGRWPDPVMVLKALDGYEYQSCEHPEWPGSEAKMFCDALRSCAISRLPGYADVDTWEITSRQVFAAPAGGARCRCGAPVSQRTA